MSAKEALAEIARLWRLERAAASAAFRERQVGTTLRDRVAAGIALRDLECVETDAAPGDRVLSWVKPQRPGELEGFSSRPGEPVRLWLDAPHGPEALQAIVWRRRDGLLGLVTDEPLPEAFDERRFHLDQDAPAHTFDRGDAAVRAFVEAPARSPTGELRAVLFGERPPEFAGGSAPTADGGRLRVFDDALNEPQRDAVALALAARDLAMVFGPPGTGKTRTLVEVVRQAVARGERVWVTAASNAAVDNLVERLLDARVNVVRLGHPVRVSAEAQAATLDARLEASGELDLARGWMREATQLRRRILTRAARGTIDRAERRDALAEASRLMKDARFHLLRVQRAIVQSAPVIASTAAGADERLLGDALFDRVVLDEATQAVDPIALAALGRARVAVLGGDPRQLPPTVVSPEAARAGLGTTFFERLEHAGATRLLTVQHRMHAALMRFPSDSMYGGRLVAAAGVAERTLALLGLPDDPLRPEVLAFVDTAGAGWSDTQSSSQPSASNPEEVERVAREVRRLLGRGLSPRDLAVITPYDAQVRLLREALEPERSAGLEVGSIDGFQGREKEAVVVSLVRSNADGRIGFLADTRRMNVAITRAKRHLVVVGDSATVSSHPYYAALIDAVGALGGHLSIWDDDAPPFDA